MRTMQVYKAYNFRSKDPVIDELRTLMQDNFGGVRHKQLAQVHDDGGPSITCMQAWFHGKTRRPTSAAVEAAGRAIGFKRKWVRYSNGND